MLDVAHELYEELILDHNRHPRNYNRIPDSANREAQGDNPLCGDRYSIALRVENDVIQDAGFRGDGCAISKASASLMLEAVKGKTVEQATELFRDMRNMLTGESEKIKNPLALEKLMVLSGVRQYPMRVKCATLGWHILNSALNDQKEIVSTE